MRQVFGALAALAVGWGLCAPTHAQELFPLQAVSTAGVAITATPSSVAASGSVTVGITNGRSGHPGDWVGIYTAGSANDNGFLAWDYLNGTQTEPGTGLTSASFTMTAPATAGSYDVRLNDGDAFTTPYPLLASTSLTVTGGGGGGGSGTPCTSSDSGYVPSGYSCVTADDDEFTGSGSYADGDTINGKWAVHIGGPPSQVQGNGYLAFGMFSDGGTGGNGYTSAGIASLFNIPDAPSYVEWRRRYVPNQADGSIAQIWTSSYLTNQAGGPSTQEETDVDMGEGCGAGGASAAFYPPGICSSWTNWSDPSAPTFSSTYYGSIPISTGSDWHVIGMQRLTTPSPNGSIVITVDGRVQNTLETGILYNAFPSLGDTGENDVLVFNLFCASTCYGNMEMDVDYVRVYTPSGS